MDWQIIINIGAGSLLTIGGWFARQLWDSVKELRKEMSDMRLHVSDIYVKKSEVDGFRADMDKRFDRIEMLLDKLYERIDGKADK
jgi:hypothetical protein